MELPEIIPSLDELKRGARPKEVIIRSEHLGGPSHSRRTIVETVLTVNYEDEALDFGYATYDLGIIKLRILSQWTPLNHKWGAGQAARAIFKKGRAWVRYVPYEASNSGVRLAVVTYKEEGEEKRMIFRTREDADLWRRVTVINVISIDEMDPKSARDLLYEDFLPLIIKRSHLKHMPEAADRKKSVDELLDILYKRENADELTKGLRTKVTPTAVINIAKENSQDVLYAIGSLMDIVSKAESAKEQLRRLDVNRSDLERVWEFMYKGEVPMPDV